MSAVKNSSSLPNLSFNKVNHIIKQIKMGIFDKSKTVVTEYLGNDLVPSFFFD
jgi:hypothetical protein